MNLYPVFFSISDAHRSISKSCSILMFSNFNIIFFRNSWPLVVLGFFQSKSKYYGRLLTNVLNQIKAFENLWRAIVPSTVKYCTHKSLDTRCNMFMFELCLDPDEVIWNRLPHFCRQINRNWFPIMLPELLLEEELKTLRCECIKILVAHPWHVHFLLFRFGIWIEPLCVFF